MRKIFSLVSILVLGIGLVTSCNKYEEEKGLLLTKATANEEGAVYLKSNTLIIQPENNPDEVRLFSLGIPVQTPSIPLIAWTWDGQEGFMRELLKFDFSRIKSTDRIISATLSLSPCISSTPEVNIPNNYGSNNSFYIQRITTPWTISSITWANQPVATTADQAYVPHTSTIGVYAENIDVTEMVKSMIANDQNYGFLLKLQNETLYTSRQFYSSWYSDKSKHPYITIVYDPATVNKITVKATPNNPQDIRFYSLSSQKPFANTSAIPMVAWTWSGENGLMRSLLNFNLSAIPPTLNIKKATLSLYADLNTATAGSVGVNNNYGSNNSFYIQQITAPWSLSSTSWSNQPATTTLNQVLVPHAEQITDVQNIDVTNMIKDMVANNRNYGFVLKLANEVQYTSRIFYNSWYNDVSKHPTLTIEYE